MQMDRLTIKGQEALQSARQIAHTRSHQEVDGEHLLAALLEQTEQPHAKPCWKNSASPTENLSADNQLPLRFYRVRLR